MAKSKVTKAELKAAAKITKQAERNKKQNDKNKDLRVKADAGDPDAIAKMAGRAATRKVWYDKNLAEKKKARAARASAALEVRNTVPTPLQSQDENAGADNEKTPVASMIPRQIETPPDPELNGVDEREVKQEPQHETEHQAPRDAGQQALHEAEGQVEREARRPAQREECQDARTIDRRDQHARPHSESRDGTQAQPIAVKKETRDIVDLTNDQQYVPVTTAAATGHGGWGGRQLRRHPGHEEDSEEEINLQLKKLEAAKRKAAATAEEIEAELQL